MLNDVAAALLIKKANRFRMIAYEKASEQVEQMSRELYDIWQEGGLDKVPTIGSAIHDHLVEFFKTGRVKDFEELFADIPEATFELMQVPSIGPMRAYQLASHLKLSKAKTAVDDLEKACLAGKVATMERFGAKSQSAILESIKIYRRQQESPERMPLPYADEKAADIIAYLKQHKGVKRIDALGSLRRQVPTIGDIDIAVIVKEGESQSLLDHFAAYPGSLRLDNRGEEKASIIVAPHIRVDLRLQKEDSYGAMLQYFTGSKAHNIKLREYALTKGLSLSEYGIRKMIKGKIGDHTQPFATEKEFYNHLGLDYVEPEMREGLNEVELARTHKLPTLVTLKDIRGDMHTHSSYDITTSHDLGTNTYAEMCEKAKSLGYEYIGFADHNPRLTGHSPQHIIDILKKRNEFIERNLKKYKTSSFSYFTSLETDILPSGELAIPEKAVDLLDYIVVSIHSSFAMNVKDMTKRVTTALLYPNVKIFAHPTTRLIGKREGVEMNWDEIYELCAKKNIAIEINSWPERLDLPDSMVREAARYGVNFCIDTDAHAAEQMNNMKYGVSVARRGWAAKNTIVNAKNLKDFTSWIKK
jgi:DNA polymerase (family X)